MPGSGRVGCARVLADMDAWGYTFRLGSAKAWFENDAAEARAFVEALALALQACVLLRAGNPLAQAFCLTRLSAPHALAFGTLPVGIDCGAIIARVL